MDDSDPNLQAIVASPPRTEAKQGLNPDGILLEEFKYAGSMVRDYKEYSVRLMTLYVVAAGAVATGLGVIVAAFHGEFVVPLEMVQILILLVSGLLSSAFFVRYFELVKEYRESLIVMNQIKEYYIAELRDEFPRFGNAFRWRLSNIPKGTSVGGSTALTMLYITAPLSSLSFAGAVGHIFGLWTELTGKPGPRLHLFTHHPPIAFLVEIGIFVVGLLIHLVLYGVLMGMNARIDPAAPGRDG